MPGKVKYHQLSEIEKKIYLGEFYSMVALLRTREEVKKFFKDLLTLSEVVMISRRIQVAKMLLEGNTHGEIRRKLKIGFSTISQVEHWVNNGFGGYKELIRRYQKKYSQKDKSEKFSYSPFSLEWVRKKYPLHFLVLNLLLKQNKK